MKLSIIYYSETGNTEVMANSIKEGAEEKGAQVNLKAVDDANAEDITSADAVLLGCPAKGDEEIEDVTFRPYMEENMEALKDKKVAIFGSYAWNEGEWIETWKNEMVDAGVEIVDALKAYDYPDDDVIEECKNLGRKMAE